MRKASWKLALGLGFAVAVSAVSGPAFSASSDKRGEFALEWAAPAGCPSTSEVEAEITKLLGGLPREHTRENLTVRASVDHADLLWFVTIETVSDTTSGHRRIEAATCQSLANATALIVALAIDVDAVAAHAGKVRATEPIPAPPLLHEPRPAKPAPLPAAPSSDTARTVSVLVGVSAAGNLGVLPSPDVGISATVGVTSLLWRLELRAAYDPRRVRSSTLADPAGAYGRFSLFTGTLTGCLTFKRPALDYGPCAEAEFGVIRGEGFGVTQTASDPEPWFGLGAGGFVAIKAGRWLYLPLHVDAVVPLYRPDYVFENVETRIFRAQLVGGRLTAGVELRF
jgi:hypothetical protein